MEMLEAFGTEMKFTNHLVMIIFDANFYEITSENMAEYGLMDKPFFKQSMDYLTALPEPFYTKFITVTNHHPFHLEPELATIGKANTGDEAVDNYFQTARYADEALEEFFAYLKDTGLLDRSIIIMYGDHYAISENHNRAMSEIIGREITPFENAGLQRVPLFIRIPGIEGGVNHTYGGQVDILPTLLHLLGIEAKNFIHFGTDLLSPTHQQLVPFRNGNYVSPTIYHVEENTIPQRLVKKLLKKMNDINKPLSIKIWSRNA